MNTCPRDETQLLWNYWTSIIVKEYDQDISQSQFRFENTNELQKSFEKKIKDIISFKHYFYLRNMCFKQEFTQIFM